jgi:hypothetical protein
MRRTASLALVLAVAASGCSLFQRDEDRPPVRPEPDRQAAYLKETAVESEPEPPSGTAVEDALAWSRKYAQAVEQLARQQEANRKLADENRGLERKIVTLEGELAQTQQELKDANDLLIDLRRANEQWKTNVLGYRDEMRQAHTAELEALHKVLRLLGGEVADTSTTPPADTGTTAGGETATGPADPASAGASTATPATTAAASEGETGASSE